MTAEFVNLYATVSNPYGESVTVRVGSMYGTVAEGNAHVSTPGYRKQYRPVAIESAVEQYGIGVTSRGMRVTFHATGVI